MTFETVRKYIESLGEVYTPEVANGKIRALRITLLTMCTVGIITMDDYISYLEYMNGYANNILTDSVKE